MIFFHFIGQVVVSTETKTWFLSYKRPEINKWQKYAISWKIDMGLQLYINNVVVAHTTSSITRTVEKTVDTTTYIGRSWESTTSGAFDMGDVQINEAPYDLVLAQEALTTTPAATTTEGKTHKD